ncbi:hypothetical protein APICBIBUN_11272 [Acinetobacter pittii 42F]|nr:hypothetical protein APICBIBUN_11272 [Acinetobacter pittii 42F]
MFICVDGELNGQVIEKRGVKNKDVYKY